MRGYVIDIHMYGWLETKQLKFQPLKQTPKFGPSVSFKGGKSDSDSVRF